MPHNPKLSDWSDEQTTLGGQSDDDADAQDDNNAGDQEAGDDE
jgi:hypothetical protein